MASSEPDESPPPRRRLRVMAISFAVQVALLAGGELYFRSRVPACDVTPFRLSELEGLSAELRPGFSTVYKGIEVEIDSAGRRGPERPAPATETFTVAVVGDSFAFGSAVPFDDTIGACLERELESEGPTRVLNYGVPGYTAADVATVVESRALAPGPDVVLWVFYANDVEPQRSYDSIPPDKIIDSMHDFTAGSALAEWISVRVKQTASRLGRPLEKRTAEFSRGVYEGAGGARVRAALERMQLACRSAGARLVVAAYPHLTPPGTNPFRPIDELLAEDARALGIEFVDLLEAFEEGDDLTRYWAHVFDHHPGGEANRLVAQLLRPTVLAP